MRVAVAFMPEEMGYAAGDAAIVVDAVRSGATLAVIAANGNPPIYLAASAPDALAHRDGERPDAWAGGELDGLPLPGFQFGNSPREVDAMDFGGREIVFGTVNGPRAARMASAAKHVSMAGFLNLTAAGERAAATDPDTVRIVCAGSHRVFALDDAVCAGLIAARLVAMGAEAEDSALAAVALAERFDDVPAMLRISDSGRRLMAIGLEADLDFCAQIDRTERVPTLAHGEIDAEHRLLPI